MNAIYQHYTSLKARWPKLYARELAQKMGISEAELACARIGIDAQALRVESNAILQALETVGETKSITRNTYAVHQQIGHYHNLHFNDHVGVIFNPRVLDLRLFIRQWHSIFALQEHAAGVERRSLQFFDAYGDAVLKVYATANSDRVAWDALIGRFSQKKWLSLSVIPYSSPVYNQHLDLASIEQEWRAMTDVHQFFHLLQRHNISRLQAFHAVTRDLAYPVNNQALRQLLTRVQSAGNEIMIFVGNRGCLQIFTGTIEKLLPMEKWLNIFSPTFTLHLKEDTIAESWVTHKPTADGTVTSLELFAVDGTQIAQLYGQRSEGIPEQTTWRQQIAALDNEGVMA